MITCLKCQDVLQDPMKFYLAACSSDGPTHLSHDTTKRVFESFRPGQTQTGLRCEASMSLEIWAVESRDIILSKQRKTKVLIRLRGCAG